MKLLSFRVGDKASYGVVNSDGIVDLGKRLGGKYPDLKALIAANAYDEARAAMGEAADHEIGAVTLLPVIPNPDKIACVGLNYEEHRQETKREKTEDPAIFLRVPSSQVGHEQPILLPLESTRLDYEGEIAVIIGKAGRRITEKSAWDHIAGFSCYNDGSVRDWQWATTQWTAGKNFPATGGFGPWMVTSDEIPAGSILSLTTRLNGQVMQNATTDMLVHSIPLLIKHISAFMELVPGDVIVTGTPGGVGARREPPVFMKAGDVCEIESDKIGILRNTIATETAD
ncbi:MAG: hypothetical protein RLZ98_723 [Pseudomonadota bacterium]|jgi:2-keto-4-pentenoate hydratase/2-oxohepta-3-ene-1,7-dioic acid hydratase in catechol pathway